MIDIRELGDTERRQQELGDGAEPPQADSLAVRLERRYPSASPAMIRTSIDDAVAMFSGARVRLFLPILIERAASATLRDALRSTQDVNAPRCRNGGPSS